MKAVINIFFYVLFSVATILTSYAQSFEFSARTGVALPTAGSTIVGIYEQDTPGNKSAVITTGGSGVNLALTGGYNFNDNLNLHLDLNYKLGLAGEFRQFPSTISFKSVTTSISPVVKVKTSSDKKLNWYSKLGVSLVLAKAYTSATVPGVSGSYKNEYTGNPAIGWLGGIGTDIKLGDKLKLFIELETRMATWNPGKLTNTENFGQATNAQVTFVDYLPVNSPSTRQTTYSIPLHSVALNVGIRL